MKFKNGYIEIQADVLMEWYGKLLGLKNVRAAACFPVIFVTNKIPLKLHDSIINHELIHFAQQKELLFIGYLVVFFVEALYYRLIARKSPREMYLLHSVEQEAYDNMFNLDYLKKRSRFAHLKKYIKHKPVIWTNLVTQFFQEEGFPIVTELSDEANKSYPSGSNKGKVSFYVLEGAMTFFGSVSEALAVGDRIDIPPTVEHSARIGSKGCRYIVAQKLKEDV